MLLPIVLCFSLALAQYEFAINTGTNHKLLQAGEFAFVRLPESYGVLSFTTQLIASDGWKATPSMDVYLFEESDFDNFRHQTGFFSFQLGSLRNVTWSNVTDLQFHPKRSADEDNLGPPRKFVFVLDNTDRDSRGAIPAAASVIDVRFNVQFRETSDPSRLATNCVNRVQLHERQFVFHELIGPGEFSISIFPQFDCSAGAVSSAQQQEERCAFQQVLLEPDEFTNYVEGKQFFTRPEWSLPEFNATQRVMVNRPQITLQSQERAFLVFRRFFGGDTFTDDFAVLSLAIERDGMTCDISSTFAPAAVAPAAPELLPPLPTGCDRLQAVANVFCGHAQCALFCEKSMCDIEATPQCSLNPSNKTTFQQACNRELKCADVHSNPTQMPGSFPCDENYKNACQVAHLRCLLIAQAEQRNPCVCLGALASCLPAECGAEKAKNDCNSDATCSTTQCDTPAPFPVPVDFTFTPFNDGFSTTNNMHSKASETTMENTHSNSKMNTNIGMTSNVGSTNSNDGGTVLVSMFCPPGTNAAPTKQCQDKCGANKIKECSCEVITCVQDAIITSSSKAYLSMVHIVVAFCVKF